MTDQAHLTAGYGLVQWKLILKRGTDGATATMVNRDDSALFLSYGSRPTFIKDTNFGYTFMVNYVDFSMTKQEISDSLTSIGTEMSGYVVYAVPTLYYQWGDRAHNRKFVRLGIGAGVGAASFHGSAQLSTGEIIQASRRSFEPRLAVSNFLEARWNHIGASFSYASPRIYGQDYDIRVSNVTAYVAYIYYF